MVIIVNSCFFFDSLSFRRTNPEISEDFDFGSRSIVLNTAFGETKTSLT